jgi:hypothetical protein
MKVGSNVSDPLILVSNRGPVTFQASGEPKRGTGWPVTVRSPGSPRR